VLPTPPLTDEDTPHAAAVGAPTAPPPRRPAPPPVEPADLDEAPPARRVPWPALVLIGALVGLGLFVGAMLALRGFLAGGGVESTSSRLSDGEPAAVAALAAELGAGTRAGAKPGLGGDLALVQAYRFAFLDGDPDARNELTRAFTDSAGEPAEGPLRQTAEALYLYGLGDGAAALALLGEQGGDDVAVGLSARALIDAAQPQAAVLRLSARGGPRGGWLAALHAEALAAAGDEAAARAALDAAAPNPWVQLAQGRFTWAGQTERQRVALLTALLERTDAPAVAGEAGVALALLHEGEGRREAAREAWGLALQADPYSGAALVHEAASRLERGEAAAAAELMERCLQVHERLAACRRGRVQALLGLGQHARARRELEDWAEEQLDPGLLLSWVQVAARDPERRLAPVKAAGQAGGAGGALGGAALAEYILALDLQGKDGGPEAMRRAGERLRSSAAPLDRALAVVALR